MNLYPTTENSVNIVMKEINKLKLNILSIEEFITSVNTDALPTHHESVKNICHLIDENYKNVRFYRGRFTVFSQEEVAFNNSIELLNQWRLVSTLKSLALKILEEDYPYDTKLIFLETKPGYLKLEYKKNNDLILENYEEHRKIFETNSDLASNFFLNGRLYDYYLDNISGVYIFLEDVIDIDDSFILVLENFLIEQTLTGAIY